jgi:hypothetical protein
MDFFFWLIILGVVLSAIGGLIWWIIVFFFVKSAVGIAQRELDRLLPDIEMMLQQASHSPSGRFGAHQKSNLVSMMLQAQNQVQQLNGLHRQRYENRVGDLMGMAAQAGIDFSPGSF